MFDSNSRQGYSGGSFPDHVDARSRLADVIARARGVSVPAPEPGQPPEKPASDECGGVADDAPDDVPGTESASESGMRPGRVRSVLSARGGRLVERWVPAPVAGAASRRGRRGIGVLAVVTGLVVVLLTGAFVLTQRPDAQRAPTAPTLPVAELASTTTASAPSTSDAPSTVVVSVVGHVAEPGLVTLPAEARVADALEAAGGVDDPSDRRTVNLARHVADGEQLYIGVRAPATASQPPGRSTAASGTAQPTVDVNTAGAEALEELPEVGEVTAKRIIEWREQHGGFDTVQQLRQVDGIGPKTFQELRELVRTR